RNQEQMRNYMRDTFGGIFPFGRFEDLGKQNIAFFERALKMFAPFQGVPGNSEAGEAPNATATDAASLADLKNQLDSLQRRLDSLNPQQPDKSKQRNSIPPPLCGGGPSGRGPARGSAPESRLPQAKVCGVELSLASVRPIRVAARLPARDPAPFFPRPQGAGEFQMRDFRGKCVGGP